MPAVAATYLLFKILPVLGLSGEVQTQPIGTCGDLEAALEQVRIQKLTAYMVIQQLPLIAVGMPQKPVDLSTLNGQSRIVANG